LHVKPNVSNENKVEGAYDLLWHGMDVPEGTMRILREQIDHDNHHDAPKNSMVQQYASQEQRYAVLGPFDSGTNLFSEMVQLNFPSILLSSSQIWKHSTLGASAIIQAMAENAQAGHEELSDVVLVLMVRSPMSQIASWYKAPYLLGEWHGIAYGTCTEVPFGQPCEGRTASATDPSFDPLWYRYVMQFSSVMDVYNSYLGQYQELKKADVFKDVLIVNYEDLVIGPEAIMRDFGRACDANAPPAIAVLENPSKDHGAPTNREGALRKISDRSWMQYFSVDDLETLCDDLNRDLVKDRAYGDANSTVPYSQDCDASAPTPV